ncbi:hypothetical protein ACQEVB_31685 [Pseudonocardia sp. CA-107938]|uniref:hypothetical protein n=1 Tax=Pseudonocardia sp. CA-107938 TaxID=3240021 RepID=UPI003D93E582
MLLACSTCFALEKRGSAPREWEDAAAFDDGAASPRCVVVDGATEAYDALRWVEHLAGSFVTEAGPDLTGAGLLDWFARVQQQWRDEAPDRFATVIEELKFHEEGSFATFLGCRLVDLDGPRARWEAAALGDAVLFHVRAGRLLGHFPPLSVDDFGLAPDGISTQPAAVDPMMRALQFGGGRLVDGDVLYLATDALARWLLLTDGAEVWNLLDELEHDAVFARLVADQRAAGRLHNDDVTLLRVRVTAAEPGALVVCL